MKLEAKQRLKATAFQGTREVKNLLEEVTECMEFLNQNEEMDREERQTFRMDFNRHLKNLQLAISKSCGGKANKDDLETTADEDNVYGSCTVFSSSDERLDVHFDVKSYEAEVKVVSKAGRAAAIIDPDKSSSADAAVKIIVDALTKFCAAS